MRLSFDYFSGAAGVADHFAFTVDQDLVKYDFKQSASKRQDFADFLADPAPSRKKARVVLEETNQTDEPRSVAARTLGRVRYGTLARDDRD